MVASELWGQIGSSLWTKNETVMMRHGMVISFSQEGLVGASNLNTMLVHLMAINGLVGLVTAVVTLSAKYAFTYEDALFKVELLQNDDKAVDVYDGHGYARVEPPKGEGGGDAGRSAKVGDGDGDEDARWSPMENPLQGKALEGQGDELYVVRLGLCRPSRYNQYINIT